MSSSAKPTPARVRLEFEAGDDPAGWRDVPYRVKCLLKFAGRQLGFRAKFYRWTGDGVSPALPPDPPDPTH